MEDKYLMMIKHMSNEELLDELKSLCYYSPEDSTPAEIIESMTNEVEKEILSRMI